MPDITMCSGVGCENRMECYRAMATPDTYQSYFFAPPLKDKGETGASRCDYYWPIDDKKLDKEVLPDKARPDSK
mgnify:CR=1 FL=1|jgi:hypothetical protein